MANTSIQVYTGQLAATSQLLYTVPAATKLIVSEILLCNTDTSDRTFTIRFIPSAGSDDATNNIFDASPILTKESLQFGMNSVLPAGSTIKALGSSASVVNIKISGMTIT